MEHYQTNGTPEGSASKHTIFTPVTPRSNVAGPSEETLPPELCENCYHGLKVRLCILARPFCFWNCIHSDVNVLCLQITQLGLCPEATSHLREMKDRLIAISNDLLDNVELSSSQIESLRQERFVPKVCHCTKYILCRVPFGWLLEDSKTYVPTFTSLQVAFEQADSTAWKTSLPLKPR